MEDALHAIMCTHENDIIAFSKKTLTEECSSRAQNTKQQKPIQQQWNDNLINKITHEDDTNNLNLRDWIRGLISKDLYNKIITITGSIQAAKKVIKNTCIKLQDLKYKLWLERCESFKP